MALPKELVEARRGKAWAERFLDGLLALADRYNVPLAGGDTARSLGTACFDIVVLGAAKRGRAWLRSGAKAGDAIYVTGALGGAAAELLAVEQGPEQLAGLRKAEEGHPHFFPEPRLTVAAKLAKADLVDAAIDVSDGLSTDLGHICEESSLSAEIDAAAVPVHRLATKAERSGLAGSALELALHGGDDYELLFTARPGAKVPRSVGGVAVRRIGRMVARRKGREQMMLRDQDGLLTTLEPRGWEHFNDARNS
jgi:thiamine-monophosphate kinase